MAFDGIITKTISQELENLSGARIDKIYEPDSNTIILGLYLNQNNYALNICINSQYYSLNLTTHQKQNPKIAPSFCMLLRKYILGMHIKNFITNDLERVVTIELEGFDEVDDIINYKLIIELMGKHGNILLVDSSNNIIDCIRHIYIQDDSNTKTRNLLPHYKYTYPTSDKCSFFEINNYENFKKIIKISNFNEINTNTLVKNIVENINGISKVFIENTIKILNINTINDNTLLDIYNYMQKIIFCEDTTRLELIEINNTKKDYTLIYQENDSPFHLNFFIDDFYYNKITGTAFKNYKDSMLKLILNISKTEKSKIKVVSTPKYTIKSEIISYTKTGESVSGDSYLQLELQDLRQLSVISDGVGSGENASRSSTTVINMLERLLNGGFDENKAIEIINSVIKLKGEDDLFATLDAAIVNEKDAQCYFIKLGAAPTYLIGKGKVITITSTTIPVGLVDNSDYVPICKKLDYGDFIIQVSDGVVPDNLDPNNNYLKNFLATCDISKSAKVIAQEIKEVININNNGVFDDDITVIISKIEKS